MSKNSVTLLYIERTNNSPADRTRLNVCFLGVKNFKTGREREEEEEEDKEKRREDKGRRRDLAKKELDRSRN